MCHPSCATCSNDLFTACLTCQGTNILYDSACYCQKPWSNDCTKESSFQNIFRLFQSFYVLSFIFLIILYCLKVRLPMTYRVINRLQAISMLIYSRALYLDYEDFFVLRYFNLLSGPYLINYRLESVSSSHAIQTYVLLGFFMFLMVVLYHPAQRFHKKAESFWVYLKENVLQYCQNFYYFGGQMMFLFIGMLIRDGFGSIIIIVHGVIFTVLIIVVIVRLVLEYHKNSLSEEIYQPSFYIYSFLINAATIGVPLVSGQSSILLIIYLAPLGFLGLITVLNKEIKIIEKNTIKFFIIEILMSGFSVAIILPGDQIRTYILVVVLSCCGLLIVVEVGLTYYTGVDLGEGNNRVKPAPNELSNDMLQVESKKSIDLQPIQQNNQKRAKYF